MVDKSLILIDEQDQEQTLKEITRIFQDQGIKLHYIQINPTEARYQSVDDYETPYIDIEKIKSELTAIPFFRYSDAIACDFNLVEGLNGFEVINAIRNLGYKSKKEVILYSAGIEKVIDNILSADTIEDKNVRLQEVFKANINYVKRDDYKGEVIRLIKKDPPFDFELEIISWLKRFSENKFLGVYPKFKNKTMLEVATEIEQKTIDGIMFRKELVQQLFSIIIDLNELPND